jgi:biopolymer transport protein ExbD
MYVINRGEKYTNAQEVESALRLHYAKYDERPAEEKPYISLRCDEKVTVDVLVEIIDLTREQKYKMVLATKDK